MLSACTSKQQSTQYVPSGEMKSFGTTSPLAEPTASPTEALDENEYFGKVELVESKQISLTVGDSVHTIRSSIIEDMNADGINDAIFTIATYPENIIHPIVVLNGDGPVTNIAKDVFEGGIPSVRHSNQIFFTDINNDNREDLLISEAGIDHYPWHIKDSNIGIALNRGGGIYDNVSSKIPAQAIGLRNYPLAAGDLYNDGVVWIVLPSQNTSENQQGPKWSCLLSWNGSEFEIKRYWVDVNLWWYREDLKSSSFMSVQDLDEDGWQDLYVSGNWTTPNHRVLYGSEDFPSAKDLYTLPDGPYGHTPWKIYEQPNVDIAIGADVNQVVFEDFDGDGDLDIVSVMEEIRNYKPGVFDDERHNWYPSVSKDGGAIYGNIWFHVLRNDGDRQFVDITSQGMDLGYRYYIALLPLDFDLDGDTDLLGQFWSKSDRGECVPRWGSTIFINEGDLVFRKIEVAEMFPELSSEAEQVSYATECATLGLGVFFPTVINADGIKGLFVAPIEYNSEKPELRVLRIQTTGQFKNPE